MKHFLLFSSLLAAGFAFAQQPITSVDYDHLKSTGQLDPNAHYVMISADRHAWTSSPSRYSGPVSAQSSTCNCLIPLDTSFSVVPFVGYLPPNYRNDDGSSGLIPLPFSFNFYGTSYDSLYINNNGNISFGSSYGTFTSTSFPNSSFQMIAPFWADVDTRDTTTGGLVYYKITPTHMIVKWEQVGYYNTNTNLLNTFQLIITDGMDTILPAGSNVSFCYGDMQWTTGDASGGVNGYGGSASTTGVNQGNGVDYFQVTQNDASGNTFDGPYGSNDGVDFLDNQEIYFNTALLGNTPPLVMNSSICDTIDVYTGDTLRTMNMDSVMFDFYFMTPENFQTVTATLSSNAPAGAFTYVQTTNTATYKAYACTFRANNIPPGIYTVTGSATDDGSPVGQNTGQVVIHTYFDLMLGASGQAALSGISVYPNPTGDQLTIAGITAGTSSLIIADILGQTVYTAPVTGKEIAINTSEFTPGVYFIQFFSVNGKQETLKFIRK